MHYERDVLPLIEVNYNNLTPAEKGIADFFMTNSLDMDFCAKHIAAHLFTSEATLSRFAKKCGFEGYRQFIYCYRETLTSANQRVDSDIKHILSTYQELLNKAYTLMDGEQLKKVAALVTQKRQVFVYGKGSSGVAAEELKLRFMRLGIHIECFTDDHIMKMNSAVVGPECLAIAITVSGNNQEILRSLKTAKSKGAATVIISSVHMRVWDEYCDYILPIAAKENLELGKLISPQFPILILCDVLYANVLQVNKSEKEALHGLTLFELGS